MTTNECELVADGHPIPTVSPTTDLKLLKIGCPTDNELDRILSCIHVPQFKNLGTVHLPLPLYYTDAVATDGPSHTFEFLQFVGDRLSFHPLWYFGPVITVRLDQSLSRLDEPAAYGFWSFDIAQLPEFDGTIAEYAPRTPSP